MLGVELVVAGGGCGIVCSLDVFVSLVGVVVTASVVVVVAANVVCMKWCWCNGDRFIVWWLCVLVVAVLFCSYC